MICPYCGSDHVKVTDTRATTEGGLWRRRRCDHCRRRWQTIESRVDINTPDFHIIWPKASERSV